jgi:hypothetical protein
MVNNFVQGSRLSRARAITERSVIEFNIVQDNPLVVYSLIQGSGKQPYCCIIDLDKDLVAHYCPDFARSGRQRSWCKHLGKVLLQLNSGQIEQIRNQTPSNIIKGRNELYQHLDRIKAKRVEEGRDSEEMSLNDKLVVINQLLQTNKVSDSLINQITHDINHELDLCAACNCS